LQSLLPVAAIPCVLRGMGEATKPSIAQGIPLAEQPGIGSLTIGGYLREVVARFGPSEAVVMRDRDTRISWSYDELLARSLEVARALIACGMGKDARVGILMTNRPEFLSTLFGISLAGGVPVALSTFSTAPELDYMLGASQISVLLFESQVLKTDFQAMMGTLEPGISRAAPGQLVSERFPFLQRLVAIGGEENGAVESWDSFLAHGAGIIEAQALARADSVVPSDIGGIFFSSGTTSQPKGIVHSQRAFAIQWWRWPWTFGMREPVRSWTGNGFFWSGNVSMVLGAALSTGGAVVLQRTFDADEALSLIEQEKLAFINGRPHQWARLQAAKGWASADLSSLKYIPRGEMIREHPTVDTRWDVPMAFGTTETMTVCTGFQAGTPDDVYLGSMGAPLPGNTVKMVDQDTGQAVPIGMIGEFCVKGPTLMSGYLGKAPEECFDSEGFYHTGDGGFIDDMGRFFWSGRLTDMIKTGGANVAPLEVDEVIVKFPGVKRTQTVGVPDKLLGEMVVSCIVPVDGAVLDETAIKAFVKREVASFKVPRRVLLFTDADYALTGNEKIKTSDLRTLAIARLDGG
jgi:fatty-acyl-CoA synthase